MRTFDHNDIQRYESMLADTANECRGNPELRTELDADPRAFFADRGVNVPAGMEVRVADNTADTIHLIMPPNPNDAISDETLTNVSGGTATVEASSAATLISCVSSMRAPSS